MLHYILFHSDIELDRIVFVDSTIQVPETLEYMERIVEEWGFKNKFVQLYPKTTFYERLLEFHFWPSIQRLWCRKYLKLDPLKQHHRRLKTFLIYDYVGVSRFDSPFRAIRYAKGHFDYKLDHGKVQVRYRYPLMDWSPRKRIEYRKKNKIPRNQAYTTLGFSGCYFCPFLHQPNYLRLKSAHPELFWKLCCYENKLGKRALPDFWIMGLSTQKNITEYLPRFPLDLSLVS